jgi:hypothetical protein
MSKNAALSSQPSTTLFERRRRVRRMRMIVDVTTSLIEFDDSLTHREACCLIDCARRAIEELFPDMAGQIDASLTPRFERVLRTRWPHEEFHVSSSPQELVN